MLNDKGEDGEYKIPVPGRLRRLPVGDDGLRRPLLPDTTYLERHDACRCSTGRSRVRRAGGFGAHPGAAAHRPVQTVPGGAGRAGLAAQVPAFVNADGSRKYRDYPDFVVNYETAPGSGIGFLAGWRGKGGEKAMRGEPTRASGRCTRRTTASSSTICRRPSSTCATGTRATWTGRSSRGLRRDRDPIVIHLYFRNSCSASASRRRASSPASSRRAPEETRGDLFDPLPFFYAPLEQQATDTQKYPLNAVTQRPMAMYHSWDSQNAWLRQIHTHNFLFVNTRTALAAASPTAAGCGSSRPGAGCAACAATARRSSPARCGPGTPSARRPGAWHLDAGAKRVAPGFLLNHLIREELPAGRTAPRSPTATPSPARRPGTTCACASPRRARRTGRELAAVRGRMKPVPGMRSASRSGAGWMAGAGRCPHDPAGLVIDLNVCVGCHACVTSCKQWNTSGSAGPLTDDRPLRRRSERHLLQPRADLRGRAVSRHADGALPEELPALRGSALRAGVPDRRFVQARRGRHRPRRLRQVHRAANTVAGPAPTARASSTRTAR